MTTSADDAAPVPDQSVAAQLERLLGLGLAEVAGRSGDELRGLLPESLRGSRRPGPVTLVVHPDLVPVASLAPLMERVGKPGFVVPDLTDLDEFTDLAGLDVPGTPFYLVHDVDRGDDLRNASPDEALPELTSRGRSPLTVAEGVSWLLQDPSRLEPNHCFMTIGSRRPKPTRADPGALDRRTPAIWIGGGVERDGGPATKGAPKVGWCWAGNRHTWLGFASATGRSALD